jgi:hypothetical protein
LVKLAVFHGPIKGEFRNRICRRALK